MKKLSIILLLISAQCNAQELFVYTEPASNMAANSAGLRLSNSLMDDEHATSARYLLIPEGMFGISKKIMVHTQAFLSNRSNTFKADGGSIYLKYRFLSNDDVHSHFRMAAFGRYSFSNGPIHHLAIDLQGFNSGYEGGLVATQLLHKVALSASLSALRANDNGDNKFLWNNKYRNAMNYTLSIGKLMLPKEYVSYKQTNLNLMLEFLGQLNAYSKESYLDIAPSLQLIINSRLRIDAGYRAALVKNLYRTAPQSAVLKVEYNFYNVIQKR